jgi:uncharacterized heparinase superfamily protein
VTVGFSYLSIPILLLFCLSAHTTTTMADDAIERPSHGSASTAIPPGQIGGNTRFYAKDFPEVEECVMVNVKSIAG